MREEASDKLPKADVVCRPASRRVIRALAYGQVQELPSERTRRYRRANHGACPALDKGLSGTAVSYQASSGYRCLTSAQVTFRCPLFPLELRMVISASLHWPE